MGYINLEPEQHEGLVYADVDWCDESEAARATGRLVKEVEDWCNANLRAGWEVFHTQLCDERFAEAIDQFDIGFDDDTDMLMFKMRWL